jgi:hypothetical protein
MKSKLTLLAVAAAFLSPAVMAQAPSPAPAKPSLLSRMKAAAHKSTAPAKPAPAVGTAKPAAPVKPAAAAKPAPVAGNKQAPRTAKSLACSQQADAKNIHGKARKSFMSHCKKA